MLRKILTYFLLLAFFNSVLLPGDLKDANPLDFQQESGLEVYGTISELVIEGWMGMPDNTPEAEDDLTDSIKIIKIFDLFNHANYTDLITPKDQILSFPLLGTNQNYFCYLELQSPPPKFS